VTASEDGAQFVRHDRFTKVSSTVKLSSQFSSELTVENFYLSPRIVRSSCVMMARRSMLPRGVHGSNA